MIRHFWVAALVMLFACPAAAQTCGLQKVATYDMLPSEGRVLIKMRIGDSDRIMIVDTGAWFSYLTTDAVDELKLPHRSMSDQFVAYDAYGRRTSQVATAPSIEIGPLQVTGVDFIMAPRTADYGKGVAGLLGANVLKNFDIDFDFAHRQLNFFSPDHCPGQVVYWSAGGATRIPFKFDGSSITLPVQLDGKTLYAELDTGAFASIISQPIAFQVFGLSPGTPGVDANEFKRDDGSKGTDYTHTFETLRFGGILIPAATLHIIPDTMGKAFAADTARGGEHLLPLKLPELLLGIAELKHLHIYISYKEKLLYVTAADAN
jgi:hypothetical protein